MEKHFASLKLLDSDSDWEITETINYSQTPSSRRICVNQICQRETQPNLVRQYNCEQIFAERATARQMKKKESDNKISNEYQTTTESYFDSFTSPNRQFCKNSNILQAPKFVPNKPFSEILPDETENVNPTNESEFSLHCSAANANTINEVDNFSSAQFRNPKKTVAKAEANGDAKIVNKKTYQEIKHKFRPLVLKNKIPPKKKRNMCYYNCLILCLFPIVTVILAMLLNLNIPTACNRAMFFSNAAQELQQKIHGQENAISNIISHINQDIFYLKVLCLVGGTGVGKSYTANIIAKHFPLKEEIFIYDTLFPYSSNGNMLNVLNKKRDKCITVIAIFNIEEVNNNLERTINFTQSINSINEAFADKKLDSLIVPYQPLNEETLQRCIIEAAAISNLTLMSNQINEIKQNLLLSASGCKGAYAKPQSDSKNKLEYYKCYP
ncbi:hypothetical protein E2986_03498 [Frieseomelitta varia]|uniref:Uncharacterized protein n=1 Tax=Frieseomelitta varia TaxID=561572 RepID=A0A833S9G4_9HYME|nr:hypothetical protein E2986_03498 [Frieseomelitta varia]